MTSFANKMQIFLWQIVTVIPIKGTRTSVNMPGFQWLWSTTLFGSWMQSCVAIAFIKT